MPPVKDWWVDGHYIAAPTKIEARLAAASLYNFKPQEVRPWTSADDNA